MSNLTFQEAIEKVRAAGWSWEALKEFLDDTTHLVPHAYCICGDQYALNERITGYRIPLYPIYCSNDCGKHYAGTEYFSIAGKLSNLPEARQNVL